MSASNIRPLADRLFTGYGRFSVLAFMGVVCTLDALISSRLRSAGAFASGVGIVIGRFEEFSTALLLILFIPMGIALFRQRLHGAMRAVILYLGFALVQVVLDVLGMVTSAHLLDGRGLGSMWDVAITYSLSVLVFTFVYLIADLWVQDGAFIWPAREGQPPPKPTFLDYLFISLNVNSTYGPTSEAVVARPVKLLMSLQVLLAILMLTVLIARAATAL